MLILSKIARALSLYIRSLMGLLFIPILMVTSPYAFGRSKELLVALHRGIKTLLRDSLFYRIVNFKEKTFKTLLPLLQIRFRDDPAFFDLIAEREYVRNGTQASFPLLLKGESLRKTAIDSSFKGNVRFFDPGWVSVFGHIANLSLYPKLELLGWIPKKLNFVYFRKSANPSLLNHYKEFYALCQLSELKAGEFESALREIHQSMNAIDTGPNGILDLYSSQNLIEENFANTFGSKKHLLSLLPDVEFRAKVLLDQLGFNSDNWFVTVHMREARNSSKYRGGDNVNPADYLEAIRYILDEGGSVLRLGDASMTPLSKLGLRHKRLLDYAHAPRRDPDIDVFALSKCAFLLGTQSGPASIPNEFGRPIVYTNVVAYGRAHRYRGFLIPKLIREKKSGRFISLREGLGTSLAWNIRPENEDFERVDNTTLDILEATRTATEQLRKASWDSSALDFRSLDRSPLFTRHGLNLHTPVLRSFCDRYQILD
jgi:putative glycosyltransferase (TIGR04372 family)